MMNSQSVNNQSYPFWRSSKYVMNGRVFGTFINLEGVNYEQENEQKTSTARINAEAVCRVLWSTWGVLR
jgi:hypothetical protein